MDTLLLDRSLWDLCKDTSGNIALASAPYALAQDVASAIKLFKGELYYDTSRGVPYWQQILGQFPPIPFMKAQFEQAALTVPGVVSAVAFISSITDRTVSGQVQIKDTAGALQVVAF